MQLAINRFITRLSLPPMLDISCTINSCIENNNPSLYNKFMNLKNTTSSYSILELYHTTRSFEYDTIYNDICKNGFSHMGYFGNKGSGIYLSNHSRYVTFWGNGRKALICHVFVDHNKKDVKRFLSEMKSGNPLYNHEYLVTDNVHDLIYPKYIIDFEIKHDIPYHTIADFEQFGYVEHGLFGCDKCDKDIIRCDCEQLPSVLETDCITL